MKNTFVFSVLLAVGITVCSSFCPTLAMAQSESLQISPVFQDLIIVEDASSSGTITLSNNTSTQLTFELVAVDVPQFDDQGQVMLMDKPVSGSDNAEYDLAEFIIFKQNSWTLAAGETQSIPFEITNAPDLAPGGHYAAVLAKVVSEANGNAVISPALSAYLLVSKLGGERYDLVLEEEDIGIGSVAFGFPQRLSLTFSNQGNIHTRPRGVVVFITPWNTVAARGIVNETSLYVMPESERKIEVTLNKPSITWWPVMVYTIKIEGASDPGQVAYSLSEQVVVVSPIGMMFSVVVIAVIVYLSFRQKKFL